MIQPVSVPYSVAEILSERSRAVIVYEPASGAAWRFNDHDAWCLGGVQIGYDEIIAHRGIGFMDDQYCFVWMNVLPSEETSNA